MNIKLAFLGTGTCNSTFRNPPALALSNGDEVVMIDFGGGSYHQLSRLDNEHFRYNKISVIFLTHFHIDHISGLPDFFWGEMWDSKGSRKSPLTIVGPPGLKNFYYNRLLPFFGDHSLPFEIDLLELHDGEIFDYPFFKVKSYEMSHSESSAGYLFDFNSIKLSISGDTGLCNNLIEMLSDSDIAAIEWSEPGSSDYTGHISGNDIQRLIDIGKLPEKIYITHIYLPPGVSFEEQVLRNKEFLGEHAGRFYFPVDMDVMDII